MEDVRAKGEDHLYVYFASKYLAERATWDFAKEHPNVDIATGELTTSPHYYMTASDKQRI